jgi:hypothetical protein
MNSPKRFSNHQSRPSPKRGANLGAVETLEVCVVEEAAASAAPGQAEAASALVVLRMKSRRFMGLRIGRFAILTWLFEQGKSGNGMAGGRANAQGTRVHHRSMLHPWQENASFRGRITSMKAIASPHDKAAWGDREGRSQIS